MSYAVDEATLYPHIAYYLMPTTNLTRPWWRIGMETLDTLLVICREIHQSALDTPHKGPVMGNFEVFFVVRLQKNDVSWHTEHYDALFKL